MYQIMRAGGVGTMDTTEKQGINNALVYIFLYLGFREYINLDR